jgi:hypothetical protein
MSVAPVSAGEPAPIPAALLADAVLADTVLADTVLADTVLADAVLAGGDAVRGMPCALVASQTSGVAKTTAAQRTEPW